MGEGHSKERIISIDKGLVKRQLGEPVRETVEQTFCNLLDAEAGELWDPRRN